MKFIIKSACASGRLGVLSEMGPNVCKSKEETTPLCLLYTRVGNAPHVSRELLDKISNLPAMMHMPLTLVAEHCETVSKYGKGLQAFTSNKGFGLYCSVQDAAEVVPAGFNDKHSTAIWGRGGKQKLDVEAFMRIQESFRPDWYEALCDSDTYRDTTTKRLRKCVERTLYFLDKCLERHSQLEKLKDTSVFGVVEGGFQKMDRLFSARETAKRPVHGFCIEGFNNSGTTTTCFAENEVRDLLRDTLAELPAGKPRLMHGVFTPDTVLQLVELGIDIFDSSYITTQQGCALIFPFSPESLPTDDAMFTIDLNDESFSADFSPVLDKCTCYTCSNYTRAYVHHLLNTSEMLAGILLMIHNFHHYFGFFEAIRVSLKSGEVDKLRTRILGQKTKSQNGS